MAAPKREVFRAAEVCEVANVQPYVLRSWEAEFPQLGQATSGGGPRVYRRADVEMILRIKSLVFGEGLTLAGARRRLEETADEGEPPSLLMHVGLDEAARAQVRRVRDGLRDILDLLSADARPTLVLAPPTSKPTRKGGQARRRGEPVGASTAGVE